MPIPGARYRYHYLDDKRRQRLAYVGNFLEEISTQHFKNGEWVTTSMHREHRKANVSGRGWFGDHREHVQAAKTGRRNMR